MGTSGPFHFHHFHYIYGTLSMYTKKERKKKEESTLSVDSIKQNISSKQEYIEQQRDWSWTCEYFCLQDSKHKGGS